MGKDVMIKTGLLLFLLLWGVYGFGQQEIPPLERKVTVNFENMRVKDALHQIENSAQFSFAYKTGIFDENQLLNRAYINKTVREVINDIFQGSIHSTGKGNYILLKLNPQPDGGEMVLEGYIIDEATMEKVPFATIYDTQTLSSAISDEYGHYLLKLKKQNPTDLKVKKAMYQDADVQFNQASSPIVSIYLKRIPVPADSVSPPPVVDSATYLERIANVKWLKFSKERKANIENFGDLMKQKVQFSVLPTIGTNGKLSSVTSVNSSFNLLGGIVGGVNGFELAGLFNIDIDTVQYVQVAGLFNSVGGYQRGVQVGGLFNVNFNDFNGLQVGGISNIVKKDVYGVQIGGINNLVLSKVNGIQLAGISNVVKKDVSGLQIAGISNLVLNRTQGIQLAGISNVASDSSSVIQIAGIHNQLGKNSTGFQLAGISNVVEDQFRGVQLSGLVNYAQNMKGMQIGFINVNTSIKGIPVGFLSFSKKGLHQFEIATNEFTPLQIGLKTGVNSFYNSLFVSSRFTSGFTLIGIGYGLGTSIKIKERHRVFFDLQNQQLFNRFSLDENFLHRITVTYQFQWREKIAVAIGPTLNMLNLKNINQSNTASVRSLTPYQFYENTSANGHSIQIWAGGLIAIRLF